MIRHVVLFDFKPDVDWPRREETLRQLLAMQAIPAIRRLELGQPQVTRSRHAGKPKPAYLATMEFDNVEGFHAYIDHPLHLSFDEGCAKPFLNEETIWSGQYDMQECGE